MRHVSVVWSAGVVTALWLAVAAPSGQQPPPAAPPATQAPSPAAVERAGQILAESRKALGGDKLAAVTSILATGQTRRVRGDNLVPIEFEIAIELPDKYVRKDEVPAEESGPTSTGFAGDDIIQFPIAPAGRAGGPSPGGRPGGPPAPGPPKPSGEGGPTPEQLAAQRMARLNTAKQDFARLMLGVVPGSFETFPMTFTYAAQAQAPQGNADVLDVRGPGNFTARLFVHSDTHLPIMLSWQAPAPSAPGQKPQAAPVEHRLYYLDYRDADGGKLPFRLRRAIGPDTTEETTFDRFRLNTKIDPRKFATGR